MTEQDKKWVNDVEFTEADVKTAKEEQIKPLTQNVKKDFPKIYKMFQEGFNFTENQKIMFGLK